MIRRFSTNFAVLALILDTLSVLLGMRVAAQIRPLLSHWPDGMLFRPLFTPVTVPWALYVLFPTIWIGIMFFFAVYDGRKNLRVVDEFTSLTLSTMLASVALAGVLYLSYRTLSRGWFLTFVTLTYGLLIGWRIPLRLWYRHRRRRLGHFHRILIVGAGEVGREVEETLRQYPDHIQIVGFLDDDPQKRAQYPDILGDLNAIRQVVSDHHVTGVVFALPLWAHKRMEELIWALFDLPVQVWIVPDYFQWTLHHAEVEDFSGIPMLNIRAPALTEYQRLTKRLFDLIVTSLLLIPALPLMGLIALAILLDDGPPVLFRQKRVGENGHIFIMYKFRTMVKDAEKLRHLVERVDENGHILHKHPNDPRVTRVGRFLRRWSLDELPQLFNVLRGTMSLVGPRPEMPYLVEKYEPWQRKRFAVPQGITGWWQIHGRSDKPMHLHTEDDLYYIQHYSIWLDIQILVKTFWSVLRGRGAY